MRISIIVVSVLLLTSYMGTPSHMQSEETQDPMLRFHECRDKFYTDYPDEIVETDWHKCMQKEKNEIPKTNKNLLKANR